MKNKKRVISIIAVVTVVAIITLACAAYLGDYYHADRQAIEASTAGKAVNVSSPQDGVLVYSPENAEIGLIFYPGGKVEYTAYEPLMVSCAERGILCVLIEMPFNLAVLDVNAADGIREQFPAVNQWYIGGHSLGGSMAASYIAEHADRFSGLILLGAYSTADISESSLKVLSIYGSEDNVMNREKYEKYRENLPQSLSEYIITGGCHAYFGMYGAQDGDGTPTISNEEQIEVTSAKIAELVFG